MIEFTIMTGTFNSCGGGYEFTPLIQTLESTQGDFGSAVKEVDLTIYFRSRDPFSKQNVHRSLSSSYKTFHQNTLGGLPKRKFLRKKGVFQIHALAEFDFAEEFGRGAKHPLYEVQVDTHSLLVERLSVSGMLSLVHGKTSGREDAEYARLIGCATCSRQTKVPARNTRFDLMVP